MTGFAEGINNVGQLKWFLEVNECPDDMPVWTGNVVYEGGCGYPEGFRHYDVNVQITQQTFGLALPKERQKTETGLMFW